MNLAVFSHKACWRCAASPSGYATDGGFALQMKALSSLFDTTLLCVPVKANPSTEGEVLIEGKSLSVLPLPMPAGAGLRRKLAMLVWSLRMLPALAAVVRRADAVHAPIPGDIGTVGMLLAWLFRKPLLVRHCGTWRTPRTLAERFWKHFMEAHAGGLNVMLATGGDGQPPSLNPHIDWIFSTSLTEHELRLHGHPRPRPSNGSLTLAIVCRQDHAKGSGRVISALPLLLNDFPHLRFLVVGDGPARADFQLQADSLGLSQHVVFRGKLDHAGVLDALRQADLFCYPTTSFEGFPKVTLEALACGLPVVTTRVSVLPELLSHGGGRLLDETSPQAIADAVRYCLEPGRYELMSQAALATASRFSLEAWAEFIAVRLRRQWKDYGFHG